MGIASEFKQFILRGNVVDLAVGIIIGGAFGKIVSSLVADVITPPIGALLGRIDFHALAVKITDGKDGKPVNLMYGNFLQATFDFVIVAAAVFALVKLVNSMQNIAKKEPPPPPPPATKICGECAMEIPIQARKCGHCTSVVA